MRIIVKMKFGAHLYGTATPDSDMDYKGIFLPTKEELLLGRVPKSPNYSTGKDESRNTKNDIDIELYALNYFKKLACDGQTVAMDMLHAPENMILQKSKKLITNFIKSNIPKDPKKISIEKFDSVFQELLLESKPNS